ncbi:MAG TPA: biotin transporter BioY [Acholeplasmataceae bacterium]|nr:biotin transporter BioY [Acholeplasmataceae bacterium]
MPKMKTRRVATQAILLSLLIVSAFIKIPTSLIPFTLQLLVVLIISFITKPLDGMIIFVTYIIIGLVGIPVFASGGGLGYIYLPSFGFIIGFIIMHLVMSLMSRFLKRFKKVVGYLISSIIGLITLYLVGIIYALFIFNVYQDLGYSIIKILNLMVLPFIAFDLIKCLLASIIVSRLDKIINIRGDYGI